MGTRVLMLVEIDDEYADPNHEMGVTEEGNLLLVDLPIGELVDGPHKVGDEVGTCREAARDL